jgi:hypothetical protein
MGDLREILQALARCEQTLGDHTRRREQLPASIEAAEQAAAAARAAVASEHQTLADLERLRRDREAALQDCEAQRGRYRAQTVHVKTNAEYQALLREIEATTRKISDLEEEVLVAMDELDRRKANLGTLEREQAGLEREHLGRASALREDLERVRAVIVELEAERERILERLEPGVREHYRRVCRARETGTAILKGRTCASCYRDVPYEIVNRILAGELHMCASCSRILVAEAG